MSAPRPTPGPAPRPRPRPAASDAAAQPAVEPAPSRRVTGLGIALGVLAVLVVAALVVVNVVLAGRRSHDSDVEQARREAVTAARTRVPALLSYSYKSIAGYASSAPTNTTGAFRSDFTKLITAIVVPAAKTQQIVTTAKVLALGIVSAEPDRVVTIALISQSTYGKNSKTAQVDGSRARVTMSHTAKGWLISGLTTL